GPRSNSAVLIRQQVQNGRITAISSLELTDARHEFHSLLKAVGQLWTNGILISWDDFYKNQNRISLHNAPNYAFEKNRCWIDPPTLELSNKSTFPSSNGKMAEPDTNNMRKDKLIEELKVVVEDASGIETDGIDPKASFIEIGLDSLLLTQ